MLRERIPSALKKVWQFPAMPDKSGNYKFFRDKCGSVGMGL